MMFGRWKRNGLVACGVVLSGAFTPPTLAHQPVMDMAPRWKGGYGFQVRQEHYGSDLRLSGGSKADNPFGLEKSVSTTWLEGIYTFRREVRLTVKIPYLNQKRTTLSAGQIVTEKGSGLGDIIIGMPLKRYKNKASATSNIAVTPSIRLPTGSTKDGFPTGNGSTDIGVSFSASFEKANIYHYQVL